MGFLKYLKRLFRFRSRATVQILPSGSIAVDREGHVVSSTVSSAYSRDLLQAIGRDVLTLFREARESQMPLAEVNIQFVSLRITARELRGGAVIFLFPQTALSPLPT